MVSKYILCCLGLCLAMVQAATANIITEGTAYQHHRQGTRILDSSIRSKRSTTFATIKVINKTGREVYIAYMTYSRIPYRYTSLRRNERKSLKSRVYTTWYAYHESFSNYMLMNGKTQFLVLPKHLRWTTDILIQPRDGRVPPIVPHKFPEKFIELMVIADSTMYKKHGNDTERYILTIVNQGRRHFSDPSLGGLKLNLFVTRVFVIKKSENDFKIKQNTPLQNMKNACNFAARFNVASDDDDRHFDFAVIFTRRKFGYAGYTPMFQMCRISFSCTLIYDRGLASVHVVPHEIAHSLGVEHDGRYNNCTHDGHKGSLMGKVLYSKLHSYYWSRCSREQLHQTLGYFECLNDKPRVKITRYMSKWPGVVMNRHLQCQIRYAKHYTACKKQIHPYYDCRGTYCAPDWDTTRCAYNSRPPLDGSICNGGMGWCIKGNCYPYGKLKFPPVHGGWSKWQAWGPCSASCGIGIRNRTRQCDKPRPKYDGNKCPGKEKEVMACKIKECPVKETVQSTRNMYCKSLKGQNWIWFTRRTARDIVSSIDGLNCTFESSCGWTESTKDEFNWTRRRGSTPSHGTGPSMDHTYENKSGHYLFIEASTGEGDALRRPGFKARLISPLIRVPEVCLTFYYHMMGSHIGSLNVHKRSGKEEIRLWRRNEDLGDMWHKAEVDITNSKAFEIHFEAERGDHYQGDIAIDDITVWPGKCSISDSVASNPCLISCSDAQGTTFLENITLPDTYRCHNDHRLDICLSGKCERLGCDLKLGSNRTIDNCRICGGNSTQCSIYEAEMIMKLNATGEAILVDVPLNSTNINIEVVADSYGSIGIKSTDAGTYFPGGGFKSEPWSKYVRIRGQTYYFTFNTGVVSMTSDGPSNGPIKIVMAPSKEPEVKFKYQMFVPKE